jgi:hypothetical protein
MRHDGTLVLVDPQEDIEAQRQQIKEKMQLQAQRKLAAEAEISLWKIVQTSVADRIQDPPVTWFRLFEDEEPLPDDLMNPFAQDDHIPPTYPELYPRRPEQGEEDEEDPESEANQHVQGDQR